MSQVAVGSYRGKLRQLCLPESHAEVLPGVLWGSFEHVFSPAFWAVHAWHCSLAGEMPERHRLGSSLREEIAACLLGGYGIPAEVGLAAYRRLRELGLIEGQVSESALLNVLREPLAVGARLIHYRFAPQKARYLAGTFRALGNAEPPDDLTDIQLRNWLTGLPGVGLKTASWITRNIRDSDAVAIIDVHLFRAGRLAGIFPAAAKVERDYEFLENAFIAFSEAISVRASQLDALIWDFMKRVGSVAVAALREVDTPSLHHRRSGSVTSRPIAQ